MRSRPPAERPATSALAAFIIVLLGLRTMDASEHQVAISTIGACACSRARPRGSASYLGSRAPSRSSSRARTSRSACAAIGRAGARRRRRRVRQRTGTSIALDRRSRRSVAKAFTGLEIVVIAGNAVENVCRRSRSRAKGQRDLAISVVRRTRSRRSPSSSTARSCCSRSSSSSGSPSCRSTSSTSARS